MKCLSVRQPWASLIVAGHKDVENRPKPTKYRGPVLIHAGKALHKTRPTRELGTPAFDLPRGRIIGKAEIIDCVQGHSSEWAAPGAWHWVLDTAKAEAFDSPVPFPGRLGIFDAPEPAALFKEHDGTTRRVCVTEEVPDVMITRPGKWGNPFQVRKAKRGDRHAGPWLVIGPDGIIKAARETQEDAARWACMLYESHVLRTPALKDSLKDLKGKRLGCFCKPGKPCHGDVLVRLFSGLICQISFDS